MPLTRFLAYDIAGGISGRPDAGAVLLRLPTPRRINFPIGMTLSRAVLGVAPAAIAVFNVQKNGVTFGTITFAAASLVGVFAAAVAVDFAETDILTVVAPAPQDLLLADPGFALAAKRIA